MLYLNISILFHDIPNIPIFSWVLSDILVLQFFFRIRISVLESPAELQAVHVERGRTNMGHDYSNLQKR